MSNQLQDLTINPEFVDCYLCSMKIELLRSMEIPLTTGGKVRVHPSCLEFYMSKTAVAAGGCGSCTGGKGCC
ncbi:MAG: hypothetical protein IH840_02980 [Candidatus Heimdallarchaeota archaeon]|nr:hypothetical protein [Candidatus Heimdallarchaeota archaeon]